MRIQGESGNVEGGHGIPHSGSDTIMVAFKSQSIADVLLGVEVKRCDRSTA